MINQLLSFAQLATKTMKQAMTFVIVFFVSFNMLSSTVLAESASLSLEQRVQHLEELNRTRNKVQADISYQLSELQREVRSLTGQVEDNNFKLKQIQDRQRDLYREIESRFSKSSSNESSTQNASQNNTGSNTTNQNTVANSTLNQSSAKINGPKIDEADARREFEVAFLLVRNKDYAKAISSFSDFLVKYPSSNYSANARFWMGQVYLVQNNQADAQKQFEALISEFPSSSKTLAAKLKLADLFLKQELWSKAKNYYADVASTSKGASLQLANKGLIKIKQAGH